MAIEIDARPKDNFLVPSAIFFAVCMVLFIGGILAYFYFSNASQKTVEAIAQRDLELIKTPEEKALESKLSIYQAKIDEYALLLRSHRKTVNVFDVIQQNTHPKVQIESFGFDEKTGTTSLQGISDTFTDFGQQIIIWKKIPSLKEIKVSDFSISDEGVIFNLQLIFGDQIYK